MVVGGRDGRGSCLWGPDGKPGPLWAVVVDVVTFGCGCGGCGVFCLSGGVLCGSGSSSDDEDEEESEEESDDSSGVDLFRWLFPIWFFSSTSPWIWSLGT